MGMGNIAQTGMQASMSSMEVISNNIANVDSIGFKKSNSLFTDLFPTGNDASSSTAIGLGVQLIAVQQDFSPGTTQLTNSASDMAINSAGFFVLSNPSSGETTYTRNGHFNFNQNTGLFTSGNAVLQGFTATNGVIPAGVIPGNLTINTSPQAAVATTTVTANQLNLYAESTVPTTTPFNESDPTSYNFTNQTQIYDSLGNSLKLNLYYVKTGTNAWSVYASVNNTVLNQMTPGTLTFTTSGALATQAGLGALTYTPTTGAAPMTLDVVMTGTTQYGNPSQTEPFNADGHSAGVYSSYNIDKDGIVTVTYSNGQTAVAGQVAIAEFQAPENLLYDGQSTWIPTTASGAASVGVENSTNNINSTYLELSNVDLATELVSLINAQNNFQANAQVEKTYSQVMQTVTNL